MITGAVSPLWQPKVRLRVRGPAVDLDIDAVIDTGFTSHLTLPPASVSALGLSKQSKGRATLADGSIHGFDTYEAQVLWEGVWRRVLIYSLGAVPLIGMRLLAGCSLRVDAKIGGVVEIAAIP